MTPKIRQIYTLTRKMKRETGMYGPNVPREWRCVEVGRRSSAFVPVGGRLRWIFDNEGVRPLRRAAAT